MWFIVNTRILSNQFNVNTALVNIPSTIIKSTKMRTLLGMGGFRVHHEFLCDPKKCDQCYMLLADVEWRHPSWELWVKAFKLLKGSDGYRTVKWNTSCLLWCVLNSLWSLQMSVQQLWIFYWLSSRAHKRALVLQFRSSVHIYKCMYICWCKYYIWRFCRGVDIHCAVAKDSWHSSKIIPADEKNARII